MSVDTEKLEALLMAGKTLQECADLFGVSKQRIAQLKDKHLAHLSCSRFGKKKQLAIRHQTKEAALKSRLGRDTWRLPDELSRAKADKFRRKRQNTKRDGNPHEFTIEFGDVQWNDVCPILGIELDWFAPDGRQENSPSFDRIDPMKGYVPGNVAIISWRANRIKNDGTAAEHRRIAEWLDKHSNV